MSVKFHNLASPTRVVKSSQLPAKIATYLVSISRLLCLVFLYRWHFSLINKTSPHWLLTLTLSHLFQNFLTTLPTIQTSQQLCGATTSLSSDVSHLNLVTNVTSFRVLFPAVSSLKVEKTVKGSIDNHISIFLIFLVGNLS